MSSQEIINLFKKSAQALEKILQNLYHQEDKRLKSLKDLSLRRKALIWAMKMLGNQLVTESGQELDLCSPEFAKPDSQLQGIVDFLFDSRDNLECQDNKDLIKKNISRCKEIKSPFKLAALHFRSSLLEDGRATYASANKQLFQDIFKQQKYEQTEITGEEKFLEKLLWTYLSIYSRPLTFNDKLLQITSDLKFEDPQFFCLIFNEEKDSQILEKQTLALENREEINCNFINFPEDIFKSLTSIDNQELRDSIFDLVPNVDTRIEERRSQQIIEKLKQKQNESLANSSFELLCEAVEMTWHKILVEKDSYSRWEAFLHDFQFIPQSESSHKWSPQARKSLLQALWFLQGIAIYEKLLPKGLITITFPLKKFDVYAGFTFGMTSDNKLNSIEELNTLLIELIPDIPDSIEAILSGALTGFQASNSGSSRRCRHPELRKEINNNLVFKKFIQEVNQPNSKINIETHEADKTLAASFELCRILSDAVHEQHELQFQFFIGNASELGLFREVYVFQEKERDEFNIITTESESKRKRNLKSFSKLLKAHYSYFQQPNVGIFLESQGRVSPRVIEIIKIGQSMPVFYPLEENLGDDINSRHQTAIDLSRKSQMIIARSGAGKVWVYGHGKNLLRWPDNDTRGWWIPEKTEPWNSEYNLKNLIEKINTKFHGHLTKKEVLLLVRSLQWVSSQPGLGCSLVFYNHEKDEDEENKKQNQDNPRKKLDDLTIPLNPIKLGWVKSISLTGANQSHIQNTLIQDGATVLNMRKCILEGQQLITPIKDGKAYNPYRDGQNITPEEMEVRWSYGTRHTSACDLTNVIFGKCLTITVSADGPITVFFEGKPLEVKQINNILS